MRDFLGFVGHALGNKIQGHKVTFAQKNTSRPRETINKRYRVFCARFYWPRKQNRISAWGSKMLAPEDFFNSSKT